MKIPKPKPSQLSGFALIATLSVMVLLSLIALAVLSLSVIETRSSAVDKAQMQAQANARMALMIALAELQEATGPDQRITATSSILSSGATDGRAHWTGVWDTSDYDPSQPEQKTFIRWLVSGQDGDGSKSNIDYPSNGAGSDDFTIFNGTNGNTSISVPMVTMQVANGQTNRYAYWVEDMGVKADLAWYEGNFDDVTGDLADERIQAARLAASPGVDYNIFDAPFFQDIEHPIALDSNNAWMENLTKAISSADMPLIMSDATDQAAWQQEFRHDITFNSRGLMVDVKNGGLRKDLSLAFEMDGDADISANEQPERFNSLVGEFVGGEDHLAASQAAPGMPLPARFPYRATKDSSTPFSEDIVEGPTISDREGSKSIQVSLRGPTWWVLRDYANLYKRLKRSGDNYELAARSYFPNTSQGATFSDRLGKITGRGSIWDLEEDWDGRGIPATDPYIFRPARPNYAPVTLGSSNLISLQTFPGQQPGQLDLAVCVDMFFYIWNPYNRNITCDSLVVRMDEGISGDIAIDVTNASGVKTSYPRSLSVLLNQNLDNTFTKDSAGGELAFRIRDANGGPINLAPGEIAIASPTGISGEANLGFNIDSDSGIILNDLTGFNLRLVNGSASIPIESQQEPVISSDDTIEYAFTISNRRVNNGGAMRHEIQLMLPESGLGLDDLSDKTKLGEELQLLHFAQHGGFGENGFQEFTSPIANSSTSIAGDVNSSAILNNKQFIGISTALIKPAAWQGENPNPVEVFAHYNPNPMAVMRDYNRVCGPNQIYNLITDADPSNLLQNNGINYSATNTGAFWGLSFDSSGSTRFPMTNIPSTPLISLVQLSHANVSATANEPYHPIGNSWSHPIVPVNSTFGAVHDKGAFRPITMHDLSWQLNDALFDSYYFSGFAPDYEITSSGYSAKETLTQALDRFYDGDFKTAKTSQVLLPYVPNGIATADIVAELDADDGYKKTGAYSMIGGSFNVNSTSVKAWEALLSANKGLAVRFAEGVSKSNDDTPFPSSVTPSEEGEGAQQYWAGYGSLTDDQITDLATEIVEQVKLRGPFMSLSDFVNRRTGTPVNNETHYSGTLQAAIDKSGINNDVQDNAGGTAPVYSTVLNYFQHPQQLGSRTTTTGIPGEINQAELLLPLAPRLSARSDTFCIRAYGEVRNEDDSRIIAKATCEAVVQRFPEYTDEANNEPWDITGDGSDANNLNTINQKYGRRFKIVRFRWLLSEEI